MPNIYGVLQCPNLHVIPVPTATVKEQLRARERGAPRIRYAVFVCPECGYGKLYSTSDIKLADDAKDPFTSGECELFEIMIECENPRCNVPKPIYVLLGKGLTEGGWTPKVQAGKWDFTDNSARCSAGDKLCFDESRPFHLHGAHPCSNPLLGPPFEEE